MGVAARVEPEEVGKLESPAALIDLPTIDESQSAALVSGLGVSPILADVLVSRGLGTPEAATAFLSANEPVDLSQLGDLDAAAVLIGHAISDGASIAVHGDYDCDGVASTTALTRGLGGLGATVIPRVPERTDGYGLSMKAVEELAASGAKVLIAVDCGVTSVDEVVRARELGLDVVIVDHHRPRPDGHLPEAFIVHPTLSNPQALPMCATAVAAELVRHTALKLGVPTPDVGLAELSALATVTDVMPLTGSNRSLVKVGLQALSFTKIPGLSALIEASGLDRANLSVRDLGWTIGPRINAAGRVRAAGAALDLLLTDSPERAAELAADLQAANTERRLLQQEARIGAEAQAALTPKSSGWVVASESWHPGVIGIVAGGLASTFHRPVVALSISGETATGSVRSVPGYDVAAALEQCSDLLDRFGGHAAAAGLTLATENVDAFRERFNEVVRDTLPLNLRRPRVRVDAVVTPGEIGLGLAEELAQLEPSGEGNPPVNLAVQAARLERPVRMGEGKHARFAISVGEMTAMGVAFNARERLQVAWSEPADVVGNLEINRWGGKEEPRFSVLRAVPAELPRIEVVAAQIDWLDHVKHELIHPTGAGEITTVLPPRKEAVAARGGVATISRLVAGGYSTLAVVADVPRRLPGLQGVVGGFSICDWATVALSPEVCARFERVVLLDPPTSPSLLEMARITGPGWIYRGWGAAEVRFALKVHEHDTDIDSQLRPFFRDLRAASGQREASERLRTLQGPGRHPRSAVAVAGMLSVLQELDVAKVDLDDITVELGKATGDLDSSLSWRRAQARLEEGRTFLHSLTSTA